MNNLSFFLGANTPAGFYSLFNELYNPFEDWNMYIIKGGPGTGKSSLMKKVAKEATRRNIKTELIYCSSDPLSLDGIIMPEIKVAVADGTSPHIINPVFPGICEHTIDLGQYWNYKKLKNNKDQIKKLTTYNSDYHKQCIKYLKAAAVLESDITKIVIQYFNKEKADRFIKRLCENKLRFTENDKESVSQRFLSVISPLGIAIQYETLFRLCDTIINLKDNTGVISDYILNKINDDAQKKKINRIICPCVMNPDKKIDHLIFPDLRLGIFTSNMYHPMIKKDVKTINTERFINEELRSQYKNRLTFLNKSKSELIKESVETLKKAKSTHDLLESYYMSAMDFSGVSDETDKLINECFT